MSKYIKPIIIFLLFSFSNTFSETLDNKDKNGEKLRVSGQKIDACSGGN